MRIDRGAIHDDRGIILYPSLLILSLLMAVGVGALVSTQNNFKISSNLRGENVAFYLAEAGIEWSKGEIGDATTHPPHLSAATQVLAPGTFSASALSSIALSPLVAKSVVRATGAFGLSSSTIQVQITKTYDLADAALALRGDPAGIRFSGNSFVLSGIDYDPLTGGEVVGSHSYPGISVSDESLMIRVESELSSSQLENITGTDPNGARVARSDSLPAPMIARLTDDLCGAAHSILTSIPSGGSLSVGNQNWGTRASPELRCIEGLSTAGDSVDFTGNFSGAGIMVVKNAALVLSGTFRWDGLIIVTGNGVAFKVVGGETKEIYGSVMINESGPSTASDPPSLDIEGAIRVLFSRSALGNITPLVPMATFPSIYGALPFRITQNYWRIVTP